MGKVAAGGLSLSLVVGFSAYAFYDYYSGGTGMPAAVIESAVNALGASGVIEAEQPMLPTVGMAPGENLLLHEPLISSDLAAAALIQLKKTGSNGCPNTTASQILLNPARPTSIVCLGISAAFQAPSSEITFVPYMPQEVVSLDKTCAVPNNAPACRQLFQRLGKFAQSLFHGPNTTQYVQANQDVAVAVQLRPDSPFPSCDVHSIPQGGKL